MNDLYVKTEQEVNEFNDTENSEVLIKNYTKNTFTNNTSTAIPVKLYNTTTIELTTPKVYTKTYNVTQPSSPEKHTVEISSYNATDLTPSVQDDLIVKLKNYSLANEEDETYLKILNFLNEFDTEDKRAAARSNLGIFSGINIEIVDELPENQVDNTLYLIREPEQ